MAIWANFVKLEVPTTEEAEEIGDIIDLKNRWGAIFKFDVQILTEAFDRIYNSIFGKFEFIIEEYNFS